MVRMKMTSFLAYENAKRIVTETGADAVKLEGGEKILKLLVS